MPEVNPDRTALVIAIIALVVGAFLYDDVRSDLQELKDDRTEMVSEIWSELDDIDERLTGFESCLRRGLSVEVTVYTELYDEVSADGYGEGEANC
jgi:hypothetical protein